MIIGKTDSWVVECGKGEGVSRCGSDVGFCSLSEGSRGGVGRGCKFGKVAMKNSAQSMCE